MEKLKVLNLIVGEPASPQRVPLDLRNWLYAGGAACHRSKALAHIRAGRLGRPIPSRLGLLSACRDVMQQAWEQGGSIHTAISVYGYLAQFFAFADNIGTNPTLENAESLYLRWTEHETQRSRLGQRTPYQTYSACSTAGRVLASALGRPPLEFIQAAGVYKPRPPDISPSSRMNLGQANEFVQDLKDVIACLTPSAILSKLPVTIRVESTGRAHDHYSGLHPPECMTPIDRLARRGAYERKNHLRRWKAALVDTSLSRRYPLYNLRIAAEFMLFVAATGMNRDQAAKLHLEDYRFQSFEAGYRVKAYKGRAKSEVEFGITAGYRPLFEAYLKFRKEDLPFESELLFPVITKHMSPSDKFHYINIRELMQAIGRHWFPPQTLRKLKSNFVYRLSGSSSAEAALLQHSSNTFFRHYFVPNHQQATKELQQFFKLCETQRSIRLSPARGSCPPGSVPTVDALAGTEAPKPDCTTPSACLFCAHHKGISSFDYVWGLVSFLEVKRLELQSYRRQSGAPPGGLHRTLERLDEILRAFSLKSKKHLSWYDRALSRAANGQYHPRWRGFIELFEGLA